MEAEPPGMAVEIPVWEAGEAGVPAAAVRLNVMLRAQEPMVIWALPRGLALQLDQPVDKEMAVLVEVAVLRIPRVRRARNLTLHHAVLAAVEGAARAVETAGLAATDSRVVIMVLAEEEEGKVVKADHRAEPAAVVRRVSSSLPILPLLRIARQRFPVSN